MVEEREGGEGGDGGGGEGGRGKDPWRRWEERFIIQNSSLYQM